MSQSRRVLIDRCSELSRVRPACHLGGREDRGGAGGPTSRAVAQTLKLLFLMPRGPSTRPGPPPLVFTPPSGCAFLPEPLPSLADPPTATSPDQLALPSLLPLDACSVRLLGPTDRPTFRSGTTTLSSSRCTFCFGRPDLRVAFPPPCSHSALLPHQHDLQAQLPPVDAPPARPQRLRPDHRLRHLPQYVPRLASSRCPLDLRRGGRMESLLSC